MVVVIAPISRAVFHTGCRTPQLNFPDFYVSYLPISITCLKTMSIFVWFKLFSILPTSARLPLSFASICEDEEKSNVIFSVCIQISFLLWICKLLMNCIMGVLAVLMLSPTLLHQLLEILYSNGICRIECSSFTNQPFIDAFFMLSKSLLIIRLHISGDGTPHWYK